VWKIIPTHCINRNDCGCVILRQKQENGFHRLISYWGDLMTKGASIDRDTLYDEIWRIPMITLGEEKYGVSRPTIRWACIQMGVPRPPQTYWAQTAAVLWSIDSVPLVSCLTKSVLPQSGQRMVVVPRSYVVT